MVLVVVVGAQFVLPLSLAGTGVALPSIGRELGMSTAELQFVVNGFNLCFAVSTILWGRLTDMLGYHIIFRCGVAAALVGSLASSASTSLAVLNISRMTAGIGAGAILTNAAVILSVCYDGQDRRRAFTAFGFVNGLGLAIGPFVSGSATQAFGWRSFFAIHAALLIFVLMGSYKIPNIKLQQNANNLLASILSTLKNAEFVRMTLVPVAGAIGFISLLTYLPIGIQAIYCWDETKAGMYVSTMTIPVLISPMIAHGLLKKNVGPEALMCVSLMFLTLAPVALLSVRQDISPHLSIGGMILSGLGFGLPLGLIDGQALGTVEERNVGIAAGILNLLRIGSEAVFVALYGSLIVLFLDMTLDDSSLVASAASGQPGYGQFYTKSQSLALVSMSILNLAILLTFLHLRRKSRNR